ncbi:MAG TPA: hypothetical protein VHS97_20325, partial [Isosphaeraceae bacterium]|nr:hypothetical protein [Isosphaeraceae bacterium]
VRSIHDVDGRRLATLDLAVTLADGTTTLVGEAVVEINDEEQVRRASSTASGVRMAQSMEGR